MLVEIWKPIFIGEKTYQIFQGEFFFVRKVKYIERLQLKPCEFKNERVYNSISVAEVEL